MRFRNRVEAGQRLGHALLALADENPIVLALPRGGVPVAAEVARALAAPLDVIVARKIGAPFQPELAIGAVAEDGATFIDRKLCDAVGVSASDALERAERTRLAVAETVTRLRGTRLLPDLTNHAVILVDDGLATGATAHAAVRAIAALKPRHLVLAVPVAAAQTAARLRPEVDELVALEEPTALGSVGQWYQDFRPVADEEVDALLARAAPRPRADAGGSSALLIAAEGVVLRADLTLPAGAQSLVLFAHGSGSGRASPRNRAVARTLQASGFGTLLVDLLSEREQALDAESGRYRFDIALLASRLVAATDWIATQPKLRDLPLGYFGSSTGAAAALLAAAARPDRAAAVVSRGGRIDLAGAAVHLVHAPTLLLVGSEDETVLELNERALAELRCEKQLYVIEGAGHLFEEPGALEVVTQLALRWFAEHRMHPTIDAHLKTI